MRQSGPVCRHDEDVVVDEDSDDQDDKTNRLKVSEVYSLIFSYSSIHICILCVSIFVQPTATKTKWSRSLQRKDPDRGRSRKIM